MHRPPSVCPQTHTNSHFLNLNLNLHLNLETRERALESRFRFVHNRLRNHSESVAFFGGDGREKEIADAAFGELAAHQKEMTWSKLKWKFAFHCVNKVQVLTVDMIRPAIN